jgi:hypothetical protein
VHGVSSEWWRLAGVMMALALAASPAVADRCAPDRLCPLDTADRGASGPNDSAHAGAAEAIAAEVARPLPSVTLPATARVSSATGLVQRSWPVRLVESIDVGARFKALSRLRILRLWDTPRVTVFFGVDHAGHAGLHVQQQDPYDVAPIRLTSALAVAPPLRAVPLASR